MRTQVAGPQFRLAALWEVMSFEMPTSTQVKINISVESAKTLGRLRECFVIELT